MARTQAKNYDEVRGRILQQSARVFAEQGYAVASIADLALANGISKGLLYHYFASKRALLNEMLRDHLEMMIGELHAASGLGETLEMKFRNTVRRFVQINAASKDLQIVLLHDLQHLDEDDRNTIVEMQRGILRVLRGLIGRLSGYDTEEELTARTMMFVGMINYTYLWYDPDGAVSPDDLADMASDTFLMGAPDRTSEAAVI